MKSAQQGRALAKAIAKIHWSIAYTGLDELLVPSEPGSDAEVEGCDLSAALLLVDEALGELRAAYELQPA